MSDHQQNLEEILTNFGNADYSPEFWGAVNKQRREEQERFAREELQAKLANQKLLSKMYTT
jgi:hypothetical protein